MSKNTKATTLSKIIAKCDYRHITKRYACTSQITPSLANKITKPKHLREMLREMRDEYPIDIHHQSFCVFDGISELMYIIVAENRHNDNLLTVTREKEKKKGNKKDGGNKA